MRRRPRLFGRAGSRVPCHGPLRLRLVTTAPRVTVFIPVYNRASLVGESIESMLGQTYRDFELLLVDDGSSDDSVDVIRSYADPRIRLIENGKNLGLPVTRNLGLELARGEYIALLDSDDVSLPDRLARQVAFLDCHPGYAEVGAWSQAMDESGRPLPRVKIQPTSPEEIRATLLFRCSIKNRSVMGRTAAMRELGYRLAFPRCQDYDLHARIAERHAIGNIPRVLVLGRTHPEQWTGATLDLGNTLKMRIMGELLALLGIDPSEEELQRHLMLSHESAEAFGLRVDEGFLDWSEAWLARLRQANASSGRYEPRAFDNVLGDVRLLLVLRARGEVRRSALRRYLTRRLPTGLWSSQSLAGARLALDWLRRRALVAENPAARARSATD